MKVRENDATLHVQPRHRLLQVLACAVVLAGVLIGLAIWGLLAGLNDLSHGLGDALSHGVIELGADDAARASNVATSEGVAFGSVTVAEVQHQVPTERWLPGSTAAVTANQVSMTATGDHITTATDPVTGSCSYGIAVGSTSDRIVVAYGLPGSGVFYDLVIHAKSCAAELAPTSGWVKESNADLHDAGVSVPPEG
jgi:hypothetical protein